MLGRVTKREEFSLLRSSGIRSYGKELTVTHVPFPGVADVRVAFAVSKKVGNAVVRNRMRRRVRSILASEASTLDRGLYLISVRPRAASVGFDGLKGDLISVLDRSGLRRSDSKLG